MIGQDLGAIRELLLKRYGLLQKEAAAIQVAVKKLAEAESAAAESAALAAFGGDWADKTLSDAATQLLEENPEGLSTKRLAELMLERGFQTRSKRFPQVVYVTLRESSAFTFGDDKRWRLASGPIQAVNESSSFTH